MMVETHCCNVSIIDEVAIELVDTDGDGVMTPVLVVYIDARYSLEPYTCIRFKFGYTEEKNYIVIYFKESPSIDPQNIEEFIALEKEGKIKVFYFEPVKELADWFRISAERGNFILRIFRKPHSVEGLSIPRILEATLPYETTLEVSPEWFVFLANKIMEMVGVGDGEFPQSR